MTLLPTALLLMTFDTGWQTQDRTSPDGRAIYAIETRNGENARLRLFCYDGNGTPALCWTTPGKPFPQSGTTLAEACFGREPCRDVRFYGEGDALELHQQELKAFEDALQQHRTLTLRHPGRQDRFRIGDYAFKRSRLPCKAP